MVHSDDHELRRFTLALRMDALALAAVVAIAVGGLAPVANAAPKTSGTAGTSPQN